MQRRDFVKGLLAASAAARSLAAQQATPTSQAAAAATQRPLTSSAPVAPGPVPWMRGLMEVKPLQLNTLIPDAVAQTDAHFFNRRQTATLRRLCAVLMPPLSGYPGALDVETPEFLDFLIGVSPLPRQRLYQSGLDWLDAEAEQKYSIAFASATDAQADTLIRPWLRTWMTEHPPVEPHADFINQAHSDIRTATINAQPWREAARIAEHYETGLDLYWYPVSPDLRHSANSTVRGIPAHARG